MPSSVESVVSFSVILAETFAAVGLSTLIPDTFIAGAKIAKSATDELETLINTKEPDTPASGATAAPALAKGARNALQVVGNAAKHLDSLDVLLPHDARITASFSFQASDSFSELVQGGGAANVDGVGAVSVKAGYSALYESKSENKITLEINFKSVSVDL